MCFFIQIISTVFEIEANKNVVMEEAETARREQRGTENGDTREEEGAATKLQSHREFLTAWGLGALLQGLYLGFLRTMLPTHSRLIL